MQSSHAAIPGGDSAVLRLPELDSLRGAACLSVLLYHLAGNRVGDSGRYGVELFFIISGFVILMTASNARCLRDFLASRVARLYPSYWAAVTTTVVLAWALEGADAPWYSSLPADLANLTMFQGFLGIDGADGSYWTLLVELEFYLAVGLVLAAGKLARADLLSCWLLAAAHAVRLLMSWHDVRWLHFSVHGRIGHNMTCAFLYYCGFFVIGMCLFRFRSGKATRSTVIAMLLGVLYSGWGRGPSGTAEYLGVTCLLSAAVWLAVSGRLRVLRWRPLVLLGAISYPLYLLHQRIGLDLLAILHARRVPGVAALPTTLLAVTSLAVAVHVLVGKPLRPRLRRALSRSRGQAASELLCDNKRFLQQRDRALGPDRE